MRGLLAPFSLLFGLIVESRYYLYRHKILKSVELPKPVISVGNLTVGGTGKTPFIDVLLTQLEEKNLRAAVLTRGYGRKYSKIVEVEPNTEPEKCGDEPLWLKTRHPKAQIIVGKKRREAARKVKDVDVVLLDDGLQHLAIKRNLEITLLDATQNLEEYRLLPWGRARESFKALRRTDFVVFTKVNQAADYDPVIEKVLQQGILDVIESEIIYDNSVDISNQNSIDISGKKVFLVSAIAQPESFEKLVADQNAHVKGHKKFADHHFFTITDLQSIENEAKNCDMVLVTEKDSTKWQKFKELKFPVAVVKTKMKFYPELPAFYDLVADKSY